MGFKFHECERKKLGKKKCEQCRKRGNGENATKTTEYNKSALKAQLSELICMPFARSCTQNVNMWVPPTLCLPTPPPRPPRFAPPQPFLTFPNAFPANCCSSRALLLRALCFCASFHSSLKHPSSLSAPYPFPIRPTAPLPHKMQHPGSHVMPMPIPYADSTQKGCSKSPRGLST